MAVLLLGLMYDLPYNCLDNWPFHRLANWLLGVFVTMFILSITNATSWYISRYVRQSRQLKNHFADQTYILFFIARLTCSYSASNIDLKTNKIPNSYRLNLLLPK